MQRIKQLALFGLLAMALVLAAGCQSNKAEKTTEAPATAVAATTFPLTLTDGSGVDITFEKAPSVVVSLSPAASEITFAVGKGDLLKGRTDYCSYPPEVLNVQSMGSIMEPNIEAIVALKPDVVFVSDMFPAEIRSKIEGLGIKVFDLSSHDKFDGVYAAIENAGKILDASPKATEIVADMKAKVADVAEKVKGVTPKTAYYVVGFGEYGDYTAGKGTFIDQLITMAGGVNAANDVEGWKYSIEKLIEKNPDYLIAREADTAAIATTNGYKDLTAVKEGRLIGIQSELLDIQGPRSADGVLAVAKILYPELFK